MAVPVYVMLRLVLHRWSDQNTLRTGWEPFAPTKLTGGTDDMMTLMI